ncbi:TetR/AcrR family transcriptional regulator [Corynebacterium pygosceleis]|uniref:TetR/AcrR family transcriptional regulator n=1 Tax=Corynebacterium pygosceleis TaxID=2800406 RepID=A0A9Q4GME9_9CORY|nr:TetR/AcrR family transcriptional regulator [Corynebacterium pygosceleis]MCK7636466.1 TetR/AcrR family transcriptional regulator [Corynebacterium pygosceleis]MCK7675040.1 TetR/AcrR family transcriptional regulator [Corynebacterium pygosceleis]MCL0121451.1 TetR/AcrR family transcriptional regulator [Corynebacterium pygosceleis]MCX7469220.1 TetR/AcrR family transcriptional regulator [Corynebacterium pygosceleis]
MPEPVSGRGRPGYSREDILRAAVDAFNAAGYEATSMGALADRLGVTKSALYHHVSSKEELLDEALDRALDTLGGVIDEVGTCEGGDMERLRLLVRGTTLALCAEAPYVTLLLRLRGNSDVERRAMDRRREYTRTVVDLVSGAQADGDLRADVDPATVGRLLFGMVNSLVEWYRPDGHLSPAELAELTGKMAFGGLVPRS